MDSKLKEVIRQAKMDRNYKFRVLDYWKRCHTYKTLKKIIDFCPYSGHAGLNAVMFLDIPHPIWMNGYILFPWYKNYCLMANPRYYDCGNYDDDI